MPSYQRRFRLQRPGSVAKTLKIYTDTLINTLIGPKSGLSNGNLPIKAKYFVDFFTLGSCARKSRRRTDETPFRGPVKA